MSVKNRLKEFIKSQKLTISAFEKDINVSNGYVNSISKGIGGEVLMTILEKSPNLNVDWLLTGQGSMLKSDNSAPQNISNVKGSVFANAGNINTGNIGNINFDNPSKDAMYQQEIYRLQSENDILRKSNEMLEREIASFKSILDQQRESQVMLKELYERKITDLKENITLLKNLLKE